MFWGKFLISNRTTRSPWSGFKKNSRNGTKAKDRNEGIKPTPAQTQSTVSVPYGPYLTPPSPKLIIHPPSAVDNCKSSRSSLSESSMGPPPTTHLPGGSGGRRESFIYRSPDNILGPLPLPSRASSNKGSVCADSFPGHHQPLIHGEDIIVTPFAQILATLQNIRNNYILLAKLPKDKLKSATAKDGSVQTSPINEENYSTLASETLNEFDWCLNQLETLQTHRSVSDMASNKFKKMLNEELNHFSHADKEGNEVTEFLCSTFLDKDNEEQELDGQDDTITAASSSKTGSRSKQNQNSDNSKSSSCSNKTLNLKSLVIPKTKDGGAKHGNQQSITTLGTCKSFNVISPIMGFNPIHIKIHTFPHGLPKYGITVPDENVLAQQLKEIDKWGMDIFKLNEASCHRPLTCLTYSILQQRKLIETFRIPIPKLINFLMCIEDHYLDIPYHNRIHAADVTQSTHFLLTNSVFEKIFTDLEIFAMIIASAIHDVDHPGYTNQFLINSCSDLAIIYNDEAVLENHHLAIAFKILQEPDCDIFVNLSPKKRNIIRRLIIDLVLATDMSKHMKLLADLKTMVETKKLSGVSSLAIDAHSDRNLVLQAMIHCGDLSNPTKPLNLYLKWTDLIMEEYFIQGEKEKQCGLTVSAMCDRDTASIEKSQIGFMDYIVQPLWETWGDLVYPDCQNILNNLETNREYYENLVCERDYDRRKSLPYSTPFHSLEELRDNIK